MQDGKLGKIKVSRALPRTGNISCLLGKKCCPDEVYHRIKSENGMEESYARMLEHLTANGVDMPEKT